MGKTAWIFPGQGSQNVCMGLDLARLPQAQAKFAQASEILGWSVLQVCQGEADTLARTLFTQPCLYVVSAILADLLYERGYAPDLVAGHSLGEYVALYTARAFDFATGLQLVQKRSELMDQVSEGVMVAVMGFDRAQLEANLSQTPGVVLANDNHLTQVVLSGTAAAVEQVVAATKPKRAVKLAVSGAFHSPLMAPAAAQFAPFLADIRFANAQIPVVSNVEPVPTTCGEVLKRRLQEQITGSVRWREICEQLAAAAVEQVTEIGPGKVLTGLLKRSHPQIATVNIQGLSDLPVRELAVP